MDDESHAPIAQSPPSSADEPEVPARRRFKKHSSCINCRRRKMKCDKIKPECGQCAYSKKLAGSCQYDSYKSQAQFLQDKVDELQAKIEELYTTQDQHPAPNSSSESESGNRPSTSALTRRPTPPQYYMAFSSPTSPRPYELGSFDDLATAYPAMEIFAPDSDVPRYTYTSPAHITPNNPNGLILRPAGDALRHAVAASRTRCPALIVGAKCQWWEYVELPACYRYHLIDIFLPHRYQAGLDFNVPRFLESLSLPEDQGPHPAYIDTMCLIACAFSRKPHLQKFEEKLLLQARHNLDQSLAQADRLLDFIRASSLLARYYGFRARFVEGYTTITACARFALACGLHKIASRVEINSDKWTTSPATLLAPPVDFIDLGDRINVFWMVFMLERTFASGKHLTSTFVDEVGVWIYPAPHMLILSFRRKSTR
ncbi:hypothetical protein BOTBODRAFT_57914 [Botryobasidium botryosum FD-172 SS1]|uniref:Zn(2)-C6 fungal-type domain-containing protein n=1 Tax=Botryobasidium botryosum (strain FD-172 SS1) TaxID=930990 RepID=A0A067M7M2_BOTB1|nr:hypothetical protein BOTBODRAFT_57914 [Botryobasidium botryosum FD-172 SS1]